MSADAAIPTDTDPIGFAEKPDDAVTHRCRRCLLWFPYKADEPIAGPTEWWLCPPCQLTLIGPRR